MLAAAAKFQPGVRAGHDGGRAKEAVVLRDLLASRRHNVDSLDGLTEALMSGINSLLSNVWELAALPDVAYPDARRQRPENLEEAIGVRWPI